jgi:hypothetical protein
MLWMPSLTGISSSASSANTSAPLGLSIILAQSHLPQPVFRSSALLRLSLALALCSSAPPWQLALSAVASSASGVALLRFRPRLPLIIFTVFRDAPRHGTNGRYFDLLATQKQRTKHLMSSIQFSRVRCLILRLPHPGSSENFDFVIASTSPPLITESLIS